MLNYSFGLQPEKKLNLTQSKINKSGHAIEARIYAENPATGFLPSTGELQKIAIPETIQLEQATSQRADKPFIFKIKNRIQEWKRVIISVLTMMP
ncbi:MAG: hypothetical protein CM1200mP30_05020 [Pseudomonadota bacterium]|nr:MAG: hypothetical protein CM1200mP30_05020 [Pseudomonadota bacterium]